MCHWYKQNFWTQHGRTKRFSISEEIVVPSPARSRSHNRIISDLIDYFTPAKSRYLQSLYLYCSRYFVIYIILHLRIKNKTKTIGKVFFFYIFFYEQKCWIVYFNRNSTFRNDNNNKTHIILYCFYTGMVSIHNIIRV